MKAVYLAALLLSALAQPINIDNNPNQRGTWCPASAVQNQMQTQQMQHQNNLKQGIQSQSRAQATLSDAVE